MTVATLTFTINNDVWESAAFKPNLGSATVTITSGYQQGGSLGGLPKTILAEVVDTYIYDSTAGTGSYPIGQTRAIDFKGLKESHWHKLRLSAPVGGGDTLKGTIELDY